jgi:pilus assembly protein FimV
MLRKTVVILTMMLCSMATQLYALGLGIAIVESALNQPLRMRVELLQLGDTLPQDIRVSMASSADFERFNVNHDGFLSNIRFSVESTAQGNVVTLTSSQIVREPYLSFILDTRWPNGRLLTEHTIRLGLPVFDDQQSTSEVEQPISRILQAFTGAQATDAQPSVESSAASSVTAPSSTSSAASLQPEIIPAELVVEEVEHTQAETEVIEVTEESVEPELVESKTIETDGGDTLFSIAQQVRPNTAVSMQQTMLALQELNPEAFADGNINRLRSGKILRAPTLEEIQSIDPRDAVGEVSRQNQEFAKVDVQPLAAPLNAIPDQGDQPQGQLSVVSSDDAIDTNSGAAELADADNATLDQRIAELETQLAQRSEEADRARIEREELDSRMADLEAQIAAAKEIIRLQDIQLALLQESLTAAADVQLILEQQAIADAAAAEAGLPVDSPSSLIDDVMRILTGNSIFILFGIVLVILLLVVLMLRRNRAAKADNQDLDEIAEQGFNAEKDEAAAEYEDYDPADLDSDRDDIIDVSDEVEGSEEAAEEVGATEEASQLNVIAIVGQLIGKQQYRHALSMLNTSLQEQGDNEEVRAKISEVESLLEAEIVEQPENDKVTKAEDAATSESETKSFLDDLGIDLDSLDYDGEVNEPEVEEAVAITDDDLTSDDDLEFLSDDDVGIESVDEVEEIFMLSDDETATKLELAYAYQKMGDIEGATEILLEVIEEGSDELVREASKLLKSLDGKSD